MNPLDAVWHLGNLFLPAWGVAALMALAMKLLWKQSAAGMKWRTLFAWGGLGGSLGIVAALTLLGRDGTMAGYGLMLIGISVTLWGVTFKR
ncbi:hypothetical protein CDN99_27175 [Roseateles aquatilis]|uniref:Uncharacterized protein n=1 Tax=Roseateles aquatilis TaxID=431061 RepID=A0A246ISD5_9BURK|nr:hypothetical protein [Roseateles aquatilis]OWQ83098.1 hypothetical protein CDN99_27175 [Roseateles aquatilis]